MSIGVRDSIFAIQKLNYPKENSYKIAVRTIAEMFGRTGYSDDMVESLLQKTKDFCDKDSMPYGLRAVAMSTMIACSMLDLESEKWADIETITDIVYSSVKLIIPEDL